MKKTDPVNEVFEGIKSEDYWRGFYDAIKSDLDDLIGLMNIALFKENYALAITFEKLVEYFAKKHEIEMEDD